MYMKNEQLYEEIKQSRLIGRRTAELDRLLCMMVDNIMHKYYRNTVEDNKDYAQIAKLQLLERWDSFDIRLGTPFSYFTEIAKRAITKGFNVFYENKNWDKARMNMGRYQKALSLEQPRGVTDEACLKDLI